MGTDAGACAWAPAGTAGSGRRLAGAHAQSVVRLSRVVHGTSRPLFLDIGSHPERGLRLMLELGSPAACARGAQRSLRGRGQQPCAATSLSQPRSPELG